MYNSFAVLDVIQVDQLDNVTWGGKIPTADYYFYLTKITHSALSEPLLCYVTLRVPSKDPLAEDTVFTTNSYQNIQ